MEIPAVPPANRVNFIQVLLQGVVSSHFVTCLNALA